MHEASLAQNIYDIAKQEMTKYAGSKLNRIFIDVGEFTHVDPEALKFAFEVMSKDGPFEKTTLEITRIPLILGCKECSAEFGARDMVFICPKCKSSNVEVLKGREFRLTELEVD